MILLGQRLGEDVSDVVLALDFAQNQELLLHLLTNKEITELDVLGAAMEHWGLGEMDGAGIVTPENRMSNRVTQLR